VVIHVQSSDVNIRPTEMGPCGGVLFVVVLICLYLSGW